ncbi:MAG TPA: 4,5-DOPA dioxygenase extradiol [Cytophagaceae bacterium]|nr:4,5-DOPA dioxygenase extradiol [Cytophagaceae bacterium]
MATIPFGTSGIKEFYEQVKNFPDEEVKMPVLFIGHGSPMNAIQENSFTAALRKTGARLPKPKAIMVVSAHWLTKGTFVTSSAQPEVIYDFYGFPKEMYEISYPAPGAPEFAKLTTEIQKEKIIMPDHEWGLDHGAWTVLLHMFPSAEIPVYQLSIDHRNSLSQHYQLASMLKVLRKKGVLIIGSGNITHNLGKIDWNINAKPFDWAEEFDDKIKANILSGNHQEILQYENWGNIARLAHPSNDHFLPLLYSAGLADKDEPVEFLYEGFHHGSLSMRAIKFG